jgi:(1->4)-alpha-D-glucan 1-alpha-D-glucosylmutase
MTPATHVPCATYRLQFSKEFTFADACKILDYLKDLGITDIYASPILRSRHGSGHGYDATDPTRIDPDLGSEEEFARFQNELHTRGMGLLLDIVPNHMAASNENPWWMDVLEYGAESAYAPYFDINWRPLSRNLDGKILLPFLGRPFGEVLDSGEITLSFSTDRFFLRYGDSIFPVAPRSYRRVLQDRGEHLKAHLGENSAVYQEFAGITSSMSAYSESETALRDSAADRRLKFDAIRERLRALAEHSEEIRTFISENVAGFNGAAGNPASFSALERLLAEQNYRLAYWQTANDTINYRRFFTISDLVGVRVEDPVVFEATHGPVFRWLRPEVFTGLRIDHIDGLRDPQAYLHKLQQTMARDERSAGEARTYLLVEKILARDEQLPASWPASGTTGYDFLDHVNGLFVCAPNAAAIEGIYHKFTGRKSNFEDVLYEKKKLVMSTLLAVEMRSLGRELAELAASDRYAREISRLSLLDALIEVTACLRVYRTYIRSLDIPPEARDLIERAVECARLRKPHLDAGCFDFIADVLLLTDRPHLNPEQREARLSFVMRWQQFTGPIVAKGQEDTALYAYYPLLSLNEVGSDPQPSRAVSGDAFLQFVALRQAHWPNTMNSTTTHDTKRSEDVRARISVLSEIPEEWHARLEKWAKWNAPYKTSLNDHNVPDRNEEYFIYQTLIGIWTERPEDQPSMLRRVEAYLVKATREAMIHTRWTRPNEDHELALQTFVTSILTLPAAAEFRKDFLAFHRSIAFSGVLNGLAQVLLKITCPGVPDFYQGSELWDLRLVDPDNRQPVDFARRQNLLESLREEIEDHGVDRVKRLLSHWCDSRTKLYVIQRALAYRRKQIDLFAHGRFLSLHAFGEHSQQIISFARRLEKEWCLIAVPRWQSMGRPDGKSVDMDWKDTRVAMPHEAPRVWTNVLTGATSKTLQENGQSYLEMTEALRDFPLAMLAPLNSVP